MDGGQDIMSYDTSIKSETQLKLTEIQDLLQAHDGTHRDSERYVSFRLDGKAKVFCEIL